MGFSDLGKKLSKLGQDTKNGVQKMSDSVSISNRISAEKKSLERLYAAIGEAVYKESPDIPKEGLEDEWAAVKVAYANIASLGEQLDHVKGIIYCPNCGRPADKGDKFCAKCGFRLDNLQESLGGKMAQDIKEAGREVGKLAEGAADKTGEMVGGAAADTRNFFARLKDNASRLAKSAGEKMKSKVTSGEVEMDDFGRHAMEETEEAKAEEMAKTEAAAEADEVTAEAATVAAEETKEVVEEIREAEEAVDESVEETAGQTFGEDAWEEEPSVSDAGENSEEAAEDPYKNESRALDAMFGGADEAAADGAAPAEPASPADAEEEY
ncbi:MAG: zinc ribbon domain-containing protein [Lachnospiraceae bacterium]|nr:zinc ribbon domain-containing protein [Lachnospiraceae bacterium]